MSCFPFYLRSITWLSCPSVHGLNTVTQLNSMETTTCAGAAQSLWLKVWCPFVSIFGLFQESQLQLLVQFVTGAKLQPASLRLIPKFKPHVRNDSFPPYIRSFFINLHLKNTIKGLLVQREENYQLCITSVCSVLLHCSRHSHKNGKFFSVSPSECVAHLSWVRTDAGVSPFRWYFSCNKEAAF